MMAVVMTTINTQAMAEERTPRPSYSVNLTSAVTFEVGAVVGVEVEITAVALAVVVLEVGPVVGLNKAVIKVKVMVVGDMVAILVGGFEFAVVTGMSV
jgi:hypothetical protein